MPLGISQAFADALLGVIAGTTIATNAHNATHIECHNGDPGASGTANSVQGSLGSRASITSWNAAAGTTTRSRAISNQPEFTATAGVTVSHLSLWNALTAGTFRGSVILGTSRTLVTNDILRVTSLTFSMSPVATT